MDLTPKGEEAAYQHRKGLMVSKSNTNMFTPIHPVVLLGKRLGSVSFEYSITVGDWFPLLGLGAEDETQWCRLRMHDRGAEGLGNGAGAREVDYGY